MDVSIIFVNYKTKDLTINAIKSVIEKTEELAYEIFVVDNNSKDGSIEAIEQRFENINIIKNPVNSGFGSANNLAIKQAKGKYILCLNTDTILIENSIKQFFDYMESNKEVAVCGGQLINNDGSEQLSSSHFPTFWRLYLEYGLFYFIYSWHKKHGHMYKDKVIKTDQIFGADIFFRKSVLDEVGLFDENIFMYGEETDLCYRIKKAGYQIYLLPQTKILHLGNQSSSSEFSFLSTIKGTFYFVCKHKIMPVVLLKIYYIIKYALAFILHHKTLYLKGIKLAFFYNKEEQ